MTTKHRYTNEEKRIVFNYYFEDKHFMGFDDLKPRAVNSMMNTFQAWIVVKTHRVNKKKDTLLGSFERLKVQGERG